jgi:hypothetical protein
MMLADLRVRRLASGDALPPERRKGLLTRLDTADADLAAGMALQDLVTANRIVSETETEAMREQSAALVVRVKLATDYQPRHIAAAAALVVAPVCSDWLDRSLQTIGGDAKRGEAAKRRAWGCRVGTAAGSCAPSAFGGRAGGK